MATARQCPSGHWLRKDGRCSYCEKLAREARKAPAQGGPLPHPSPFPEASPSTGVSSAAELYANHSERFTALNIPSYVQESAHQVSGVAVPVQNVPVRPNRAPATAPTPRTTFDLAISEIDGFDKTTRQPVEVQVPGGETRIAPFDQSLAAQHLRKVATLVALPEKYKDETYAASEVYSPALREEAQRFTAVTSVAFDPANPSLPHPDYRSFMSRVRSEQENHPGLGAQRGIPTSIFA